MASMILGGLAAALFMVYVVRRRSRLRAEEDNF